MKLVVGLGNPGRKYESTRHNVGFMVADLLAEKLTTDFKKQEHFSLAAEGRLGGEKILILKPQTYMNLSGRAVLSALNFYKLDLSDLIVVYDDLDLEPGRIRLRPNGSAGGHKGMGSIIQLSGSSEIARVRIGIGRPVLEQVTDYVLMPFPNQEWELVRPAIYSAAEAVLLWAVKGMTTAMNQFNAPEKGPKTP